MGITGYCRCYDNSVQSAYSEISCFDARMLACNKCATHGGAYLPGWC